MKFNIISRIKWIFQPQKQSQNKEVKQQSQILERIYVIVISVSMLWMSSLFVSEFLVSCFLNKPNLSPVIDNLKTTSEIIENESNQYKSCILDKGQTCRSDSVLAGNTEKERLMSLKIQNDAIINFSINALKECESDRLSIFMQLHNYQVQNNLNIEDLIYKNMTNKEPCKNLKKQLELEMETENARNLVLNFTRKSGQTFESFASSTKKVVDYSNKYVTAKKIPIRKIGESIKDHCQGVTRSLSKLRNNCVELEKCIDAKNTSQCPNLNNSFLKHINEVATYADTKYHKLSSVYESLFGSVYVFSSFLKDFAEELKTFAENPVVVSIESVIPVPSFDWVDWYDGTIGKAEKREEINFTKKINEKSNEALQKIKTTILNNHNNAIDIYDKQQINTNRQSLKQGELDKILNDFNLPEVQDPEKTAKNYKKNSTSFLKKFDKSVSQISWFPNVSTVNFNFTYADWNKDFSPGNQTGELLKSFLPADWSFFLYHEFSFENFVSGFQSIGRLAYYGDILFRIFSMIHTIKKHIDTSKVLTPPVDIRTFQKNEAINPGKKVKMTPVQKLFYILFHPAVCATILIGFLWIGLSIFFAIYLPIFNKFVDACIKQKEPSSVNTMLTANSKTLAMHYALRDGSLAKVFAIDELNAEYATLCANHTTQFKQLYFLQAKEASIAQRGFNISSQAVKDLNICLKQSIKDTVIRTMISSSICMDDTVMKKNITPLVYNCEAISPCSPECSKPDNSLITLWTWTTACGGEGYLHTNTFYLIFSIILYVLLNISRILAVMGIRYVLWKELSPNQFSFIATCNLIEENEDNESTNMKLTENARNVVEKKLRSYKHKGYMMLLIALILITSGFIAIFYVSIKTNL